MIQQWRRRRVAFWGGAGPNACGCEFWAAGVVFWAAAFVAVRRLLVGGRGVGCATTDHGTISWRPARGLGAGRLPAAFLVRSGWVPVGPAPLLPRLYLLET